MLNPQTMTEREELDARDRTFYLVKKYTSYTFLDHARKQYQAFLNAFARQLNDPGLVDPGPDHDVQRWVKANFADGTYEGYYREFLAEMIPIEEGLKLLRNTPHKEEAYRSILSNRFAEELGGRGADFRSLDHDPFYHALGYYSYPRGEPTREFLNVQIAEEAFEVLQRTLLGCGWHLKDRQRGTYHWTYESFFESYDNTGGRGCPPVSYPPVLPSCPPRNPTPESQIWSGDEIPTTGIWEPWFIEEQPPEPKESLLGGIVDRLKGKAKQEAEATPTAKFTGKVGCPNYFLAGATAFEYEMEGTDKKAKVAWRLLWEDTRYLDGTIPEEENEYFVAPETVETGVLTARPGEPCPESGEWYAVNWEGKRMTLQKGEPMPGPEFSTTGAVIWHLRKEKP